MTEWKLADVSIVIVGAGFSAAATDGRVPLMGNLFDRLDGSDAATPASARARLGGISFLHRFGSALNHHVHLHAYGTDDVFVRGQPPYTTAPPRNTISLPGRQAVHSSPSVSCREAIT